MAVSVKGIELQDHALFSGIVHGRRPNIFAAHAHGAYRTLNTREESRL